MGYACPVCGEPQADGEHLANHLAFSALLGRADHADWLDEHAPDWGDDGPEELAERVTPHAESVDLPPVTDDAELPDPPAGARTGGLEDALARQSGPGREARPGRERLDPETRQVVAEARELTRQRRESGGADEADEAEDDDTDEAETDDEEGAETDDATAEPDDETGDGKG